MNLAVVLILLGLVLGIPTIMYRYSRPRRSGEPFGPVRAVLLSLSLIGLLCTAMGAVMLFDV